MSLKKRVLSKTLLVSLVSILVFGIVVFIFLGKIPGAQTPEELNRSLFVLAGFTALILLAALLLMVFFSARVAAGISASLLTLNEGLTEISNGNLDRKLDIKTGDELEQLASSFNDMTKKLQTHITKIAHTTDEQERIAAELRVARRIQTSMLPNEFPPFSGRNNEFDLYAEIFPAKDVGGDFYDFFFIDDDHFVLLISDVSGKGIPAALFMALARTLIRTNLQNVEDTPAVYLSRALETVNHQLSSNNVTDTFVTLWIGVLEISSGTLFFVNAGHNPPLFKKEGGKFEFLASMPDFVLAGMDSTHYHYRQLQLGKGDTIFLYTDGITDTVNQSGASYGKERLQRLLNAQPPTNLRPIFSALRADIENFASEAEQYDDISMIALRFSAPQPVEDLLEEDMNDSGEEARLVLPASIGKVHELSTFIKGKLEHVGCPEKILSQIELAAEEIFVNIAKYAYPDVPNGSCEIKLKISIGTVVTLIFTDRGIPFNPLKRSEPNIKSLLKRQKRGGLGLVIVKKVMDVVEYSYDDGMNRLLLKKCW